MAIVASTPTGDAITRPPHFAYLEWAPVIVGALGAAAISLVLFTFGSALGLSAVSPYPYSGLSATTFFIVAALFAALVQVGSFAAGGYVAGRMRTPWAGGLESEQHFRDGSYGFAVWALCLVIGAFVAVSGVTGALKTAVQTTATVGAGAAAAAGPSIANRVSMDPSDMAIDYLLRPARGGATAAAPAAPAATPAPAAGTTAPAMPATMPDAGMARTDMNMMNRDSRADLREPLTRVFTGSLTDGKMSPANRTYLAQVVARQSGMSQADAEKRVDEAYAEAKNAEQKAREAAEKARKISAIAAFLAAATLLIACVAACAGAALGGKHRDEQTPVRLFGASRFW